MRLAFLCVFSFFLPNLIGVSSGQTQTAPNTGKDNPNTGSTRFFSQMVHDGVFNGREAANLLSVWNGQDGDKEINKLFGVPDSANDAEWEIGAFTVANQNNTDNDSFYYLWPLSDNSMYENGVVAGQAPGGRDELDLIKLVVRAPEELVGMDQLKLVVSGGDVWIYADSKKQSPPAFLSSAGGGYYVFDRDYINSHGHAELWVELRTQTPMNGVNVAVLYDADYDAQMGFKTKSFDRCTMTGVWVTGHERVTQSMMTFIGITDDERTTIRVKDVADEFVEGSNILIYDSTDSFDSPILRTIIDIVATGIIGELDLVLNQPMPFIFRAEAGAPIRMGPNRLASSVEYLDNWGGEIYRDHMSILGAGDGRQMRNLIEFAFRIEPAGAVGISVAPPDALPRKLLRFDVTRQIYLMRYVNGEVVQTKIFPVGDELANDDPDDADEDNRATSSRPWIFSMDVPGWAYLDEVGGTFINHPEFGSAAGGTRPASVPEPIGTILTHEMGAAEFVRLRIGSDVESVLDWGNTVLGSRCSDKLYWEHRYHAEVVDLGEFRWHRRLDNNYIRRIQIGGGP